MSGSTEGTPTGDGGPSPKIKPPKLLVVAWAVTSSLLGVVQFSTGYLHTPLQLAATLATTVLVGVVVAWVWVWRVVQDQSQGRNPRAAERWLAGIAIGAIGVFVLDVVAFASHEDDDEPPGPACLYDVSGAQSAGALSFPITPGGSITQTFAPTGHEVTAISIIAGLDDDIANLDVPHPLTLHLWSEDGSVDETVQLPDLTNNGGTRFDLHEPVAVDPETSYSFRVRNDSGNEPVGFYLKPVRSDDVGVDGDSRVHVVGHRNLNPDYFKKSWAVSGCVEQLR